MKMMATRQRGCLKTVASAILADVEPWLPARRNNVAIEKVTVKHERSRHADGISGRQDAALYGRPGGPPPHCKPALRGLSLIEMLVYMGVLFVIIGVGYSALYRCMDNSTALRHSADDIANALHAGEDWRADLRAAAGNIQIENLPDEQILHLSGTRGEVFYRFADHAIFRRLANNGWSPLLANVKASSFIADPRNKVTAWRWELELQSHAKKLSRVTPLFTFIAVATGDLPK